MAKFSYPPDEVNASLELYNPHYRSQHWRADGIQKSSGLIVCQETLRPGPTYTRWDPAKMYHNEYLKIAELAKTGIGPVMTNLGFRIEEDDPHEERGSIITETRISYPDGSKLHEVSRSPAHSNAPIGFTLFSGGIYKRVAFCKELGNKQRLLIASEKITGSHDILTHALGWLCLSEKIISPLSTNAREVRDDPAAAEDFVNGVENITLSLVLDIYHGSPVPAEELGGITGLSPQTIIREIRQRIDSPFEQVARLT